MKIIRIDSCVSGGLHCCLHCHEILYFNDRNYFRFYKMNFSPGNEIVYLRIVIFIDNTRYDVRDIRV